MTETIEECRARIRDLLSGRGKTSRWITEHLTHEDETACLIYPFAWEAGHYPKWKRTAGGHNYPIHRMMCEYRHGPAPTPEHHSAHSCGCGTQGCVNGMHVDWKTPSQNQFDRFQGPVKPRFKLTPDIVEQIRMMPEGSLPGDIAKQFGVTVRNVRFVLSGKAWATTAPKIFTELEVIDIRHRGASVSSAELAEEYGASQSAIRHIIVGRTYRWVSAVTAHTQLP